MRKVNFLGNESISLPISMALKSKNYPVICNMPECFRRMLKQNYVRHCIKYHNFSAEDDLPQCRVDTELLTFL